jgi:hypothetical protein
VVPGRQIRSAGTSRQSVAGLQPAFTDSSFAGHLFASRACERRRIVREVSAARHDGDVSRLQPAASRHDGRSVEGLGQESSTLVDTLVSVVGTADHETLLAVRQILLSAMFPAMQKSAREVVLPLFELG